jgi:Reverse transcriptase (RNA-dependent DNA polymerase)
MKTYFGRALENISKYGDTDIFPFPMETHVFHDCKDAVVELLLGIDNNFSDRLAQFPPANHSALVPVGYTGFRWATQIDPLWNAHFLGVVISIADAIEASRINKDRNTVFSYRYLWNNSTKELFDPAYNWRAFIERSIFLARERKFVVSCDISDFYSRLNHHRLENALKHLDLPGNQPSKIMEFLANFSGTISVGMPVGGPAARILSELYINQVDRLLDLEGISFCRFADDYHMFSDTYEGAFKALVFLSEKLLQNLVLQLQKSKTRIMSSSEFLSTSPLTPADDEASEDDDAPSLKEQSQNLMRFSFRFDPYSPTAHDDYDALRKELEKIDLLMLLKTELAKSRIHISLTKKVISAIRYVEAGKRGEMVVSLIRNPELLYPIYSNVLFVTKSIFFDINEGHQSEVLEYIKQLIRSKSYTMQVPLNLAYAVRLLSCVKSTDGEEVLNNIYNETKDISIRRDIIAAMSRWQSWEWLSNLRYNFRILSALERRVFIVASFQLRDEGSHWRQHIKNELSPFEELLQKWAAEKSQSRTWKVPL